MYLRTLEFLFLWIVSTEEVTAGFISDERYLVENLYHSLYLLPYVKIKEPVYEMRGVSSVCKYFRIRERKF